MKVIVVCDANGECKGVVTDRGLADRMADYYGAHVSEHEVDELDRELSWAGIQVITVPVPDATERDLESKRP